jgi:hypothetical protein
MQFCECIWSAFFRGVDQGVIFVGRKAAEEEEMKAEVPRLFSWPSLSIRNPQLKVLSASCSPPAKVQASVVQPFRLEA